MSVIKSSTLLNRTSECVCVCVSQVTTIKGESTASPPHTVDSSDTDRPAMTGCSAADRDNMADKSAPSNDNSASTPPIAAEGSETVSLARPIAAEGSETVSLGQSADKTEPVTNTEHSEPITVGSEAVSTLAVEGVPGGETVFEAGDETVSSSPKAEAPKTAESVTRRSEMEVDGSNVDVSEARDVIELMHKSSSTSDNVTTGAGPTDSTGTHSAGTLTSSSDQDFLALTYLVHPPDGSTFERPYLDDFWKCRWSRMEPEIRRMLRKSSRLASDVITLGSSSSSDYDSSDEEFSDYEDSMASTSPIVVHEKKNETVENNVDDDDEIVLDENSSNAIVLGDDDDNEDDEDEVAEVDDGVAEVDEIVCSGETNDDNKAGDTSVVICDGDNSIDEADEPATTRPSNRESANSMVGTVGCDWSATTRPSDIEPANSMVEMEDCDSSAVDAEPGVADETVAVVNGSGDADVVDKSDKASSGPAQTGNDDADEGVVRNGGSCMADNIDTHS